jgi:hypothetical protein
MFSRAIPLGLAFSIPWTLYLGSFVLTGEFDVSVRSTLDHDVNEFALLSGLLGGSERRMVRIGGEWGPVEVGDVLQVRFVGLSTGSKSTILGGYRWVHRRRGVEASRGSHGRAQFWILLGLACLIPAFVGLALALRSRPPGRRDAVEQ